jgi:hypothetical protein
MGDLTSDLALALITDMLWTAIKLAAPLILLATLVGVAVSVLQAVTQIQEQSLTFVPKLITARLDPRARRLDADCLTNSRDALGSARSWLLRRRSPTLTSTSDGWRRCSSRPFASQRHSR